MPSYDATNDAQRTFERVRDAYLGVTPQQVEIVRPRRTRDEKIGTFLGFWADQFTTALAAMLLLPLIVHHFHPGYWPCFFAVVLIRQASTPYHFALDYITRAPSKRGKS